MHAAALLALKHNVRDSRGREEDKGLRNTRGWFIFGDVRSTAKEVTDKHTWVDLSVYVQLAVTMSQVFKLPPYPLASTTDSSAHLHQSAQKLTIYLENSTTVSV